GYVKIGAWGQGVRMTKYVVGVRQNLKLIVDHGQIPAAVNQNVLGSWGATLGGGYYVWRSGLGITKDGRLIFVYGPALDVQTLANLLQRAGAVEGMQMDINPYWMSFEYYHANGHPAADRVPVLLGVQPGLHGGLLPVTAQADATEVAPARPARRGRWLVAVVR